MARKSSVSFALRIQWHPSRAFTDLQQMRLCGSWVKYSANCITLGPRLTAWKIGWS